MIRNILTSTIRYQSHFLIRHTRGRLHQCSMQFQTQRYSSGYVGILNDSVPHTTDSTTDAPASKADESSSKAVILPDLPPPVRGYPTFWINARDAEEYLYPLYRRGWGIKFYPRLTYQDHYHDRYVAHLTTDFAFPNYNCAVQFITNCNVICEAEKHHPSSFTLLNNGRHSTLTLCVQTHTALRPRWNEEDPTADPQLSRRVPGITRRDLRFAILVEQVYDTYFRDGRALEKRGNIVKRYLDRPEWQHLVSRWIRSSLKTGPAVGTSPLSQLSELIDSIGSKRTSETRLPVVENGPVTCHACGGPHTIQHCAVRAQHPPANLCHLCFEPHWWPDCPSRPQKST